MSGQVFTRGEWNIGIAKQFSVTRTRIRIFSNKPLGNKLDDDVFQASKDIKYHSYNIAAA
jgi:hypothetical protein